MSRRNVRAVVMLGIVAVLLASAVWAYAAPGRSQWSAQERTILRSLSIASLEPLAPDPSNRFGDDPRAAALGAQLFFDTRLSGNGKVSCATCHSPDQDFQDGRALARGVGTTSRRTMPIAGTAHSPWQFWDGRAGSQWEQALGPLESAVEHGGNRTRYAHIVAAKYRDRYEAVFGPLPDLAGLPHDAGPVADSTWRTAWDAIPPARRDHISRVYANIGKAIAAYERRIEHGVTRFDRFVAAELAGASHTRESAFSTDEAAGLRLFVGKANCVNCHNGPLLTDNHFHNTGVAASHAVASADSGRSVGARQAVAGEFSCTSRHSDATPEQCTEIRFAVTEGEELVRAFKTPSLRNVAVRPPYMHAGQLATLADVVEHYDTAPRSPFGHSELRPLGLSRDEKRQLAAFLLTLSAPNTFPRY